MLAQWERIEEAGFPAAKMIFFGKFGALYLSNWTGIIVKMSVQIKVKQCVNIVYVTNASDVWQRGQ